MNNFQMGFIKGTIVAIAFILGISFWLNVKIVPNHSDVEVLKEQVKAKDK